MTSVEHVTIRNAATVIVLRDAAVAPCVLMGQRSQKAAFMPSKFVFPGGAVDAGDGDVPLASEILEPCCTRLTQDADASLRSALCAAAVRELWEETGLVLGCDGHWPKPVPAAWSGFSSLGKLPIAAPLQFVFRAITPPGRTRRFDARFFLLDAMHITGDLDDFSDASDELGQLQWVPLATARRFDLPSITKVVLAEVENRLPCKTAPKSVPYFKNTDSESVFIRIP